MALPERSLGKKKLRLHDALSRRRLSGRGGQGKTQNEAHDQRGGEGLHGMLLG
jgi:hypothetical protein